VRRALRWLELSENDRVGDFFCGLGNFTLPMAKRAAFTLGIEGAHGLVARAKENAVLNGLGERVQYAVTNLFEVSPDWLAQLPTLNKWLIDPPRDGALALVKALPSPDEQNAAARPERIVYVSCNPATLARDASILVHQKGYRLLGAGVANMFPHTAHVESIAVFVRS